MSKCKADLSTTISLSGYPVFEPTFDLLDTMRHCCQVDRHVRNVFGAAATDELEKTAQ